MERLAPFRVERIDHVHVHVQNREAAAEWYETVLGLRRSEALAEWSADPDGPLMMTTADGQSHVALFQGRDTAPVDAGRHTIAFRTDGSGFTRFMTRLGSLGLDSHVVDHALSYSLYFADPDGNRIELTTYDYQYVSLRLPPPTGDT